MKNRYFIIVLCVGALVAAVWIGKQNAEDRKPEGAWTRVAPGVYRSPGTPAGYALVAGEHALLIDAPRGADGLKPHGVRTIDAVLLTHHHRDTAAFAEHFLADGVPVRAPLASVEWLTPQGVRDYWRTALPLRNSRTAYLVLPEGLPRLDCTLRDGQIIDWNGWSVRVVETPGHSRDHVAFTARKGDEETRFCFCGDALAAPGKMWSPYTTDWDHWTDAGLKPTHESLRKLAKLQPNVLLPAHGSVIDKDAVQALEQTAAAVAEVAFFKSFERYTKQRLKNPPNYRFLAREQAESNGSKRKHSVNRSVLHPV